MSEAKGQSDFSGYWVLSRTEQLEDFLRALGFPWVVRKAAAKFGGSGSAIDIIHHSDPILKVTSLNAKGSWTRTYDTERTVEQRSAEGAPVRTTAWWEGPVLRTRLEGSPLGVCDSWRYRRGDVLVVKTVVKTPRGVEASCYWFFERMEWLQRHVAGASRHALLRALAADQRRVERATRLDTADLTRVLLDWDRWASPADEFIRVASPSYTGRRGGAASAARLPRGPSAAGSPSPGMSKSPSTASLAASVVHSPSDSRSDLARSRLGGLDGSSAALESLGGGTTGSEKFVKEISLVSRDASGAAALPPHPPRPSGPPPSDSLTFPALPAGEAAPAVAALPSSPGGDAAGQRRPRVVEGSGPAKRSGHFRSTSAESNSAFNITPAHSPSPSTRSAVPTSGEALMVYKLHEFVDARGILSVVPVGQPNDTSEPQLLSMSPEQAEETAAKLRELETDMLVSRQANANGCGCCGLLITRQADSLPDHLRVWEMALA